MGSHGQRRKVQLLKRLVYAGKPILATCCLQNWRQNGIIWHAIGVPDETLLQNTVTRGSLQLNQKRIKTNASRVLRRGLPTSCHWMLHCAGQQTTDASRHRVIIRNHHASISGPINTWAWHVKPTLRPRLQEKQLTGDTFLVEDNMGKSFMLKDQHWAWPHELETS